MMRLKALHIANSYRTRDIRGIRRFNTKLFALFRWTPRRFLWIPIWRRVEWLRRLESGTSEHPESLCSVCHRSPSLDWRKRGWVSSPGPYDANTSAAPRRGHAHLVTFHDKVNNEPWLYYMKWRRLSSSKNTIIFWRYFWIYLCIIA